jgi:ribosome-binding factor A
VTKIDLTPDFRYCKVYVSILGTPGEQSRVLHMLQDARGLVQRKVAKSLSTRVTPELTFIHDQSLDKSIRMESIFDQIAAERKDSDGTDDEDVESADAETEEDQEAEESENTEEKA